MELFYNKIDWPTVCKIGIFTSLCDMVLVETLRKIPKGKYPGYFYQF